MGRTISSIINTLILSSRVISDAVATGTLGFIGWQYQLEHGRVVARFARIRLLNEELDRLGTDTAERTASVTSKASFLAVSAGVLVAASTAHFWTRLAAFGVLALALACVALVCAAVAVRPGKRLGIQAQRLTDRYVESTLASGQVETQIVSDKATVLAAREDDLRARATWVWAGFAALALSAISLTIVFSAEVLGG